LGTGGKRRLEAREVADQTLAVFRRSPDGTAAFAVLHFAPEGRMIRLRVPPGPWRRLADSSEERFGGLGAKSPALLPAPRGGWAEVEVGPRGTVVYLREAVATATVQAQIIESVAPDAAVPSAA
jgi:hypothetical protein